MARKAKDGGVNKSEAIRELLKEQPAIKGKDAVAALGEKGIKISTGLFFLVKGKVAGRKSRKKRNTRNAIAVATTSSGSRGKSDALAVIRKVKDVAAEVGGLRALLGLVEALSE